MPMHRALLRITEKRFGCLGVTDFEGELVGIVTDGDLRRHMGPDLLATGRRYHDLDPRTIAPDALAAEALHAMNARGRPITALFVVDLDGRPVGILHVHDLLRAGSCEPHSDASSARRRADTGSDRRGRGRAPAAVAGRARAAAADDPGGEATLPAFALVLLASLAIWPELQREVRRARAAAQALSQFQGATVIGARYRSIDERGRPYTVTAATARQSGGDRVDLTEPKGDITLENGTWLMLQARQGVYRRHDNALDLSQDVTLYRDDGTAMVTASAALDLKNGAAAGSEPVHADGPFGRLDAAGGFTATDKGEQILFAGPARLLLNGATGP